MKFTTELRLILNQYKDTDIDIINGYVVNIKNLTIYKEGKKMLEQEKTFRLEQLNSLKSEHEKKLEELKAQDVNSLIDERIAELKADVEAEVKADHEKDIAKAELKLEAINEMIAEVEAIEVEAPVEDEMPIEEETPVEETQNDISTENII